MITQTIQEGRTIHIGNPVEDLVLVTSPERFVLLLDNKWAAEAGNATKLVDMLIHSGCVEVCISGNGSERVHDTLDLAIEKTGQIHIATSWDEDPRSGAEYFLYAADGRESHLLIALLEQKSPCYEALTREVLESRS